MTLPPLPSCLSRREARRRDRRAHILRVAAAYFLEHGYAGTTMSGIAAELGGSKGTLWNHFPSKEDLFTAVLDHATTAYRTRLSEILDPCGELWPTLHRVCVSLLEKVTSPDAIALHRLITSEGARSPEMSRIFFEMAPLGTRLLLARFLEGAMERGQLRRDDPVKAARALMMLSMSGCHQQLMFGQITSASPDLIEEDARFAVDLFSRAYAPEAEATA